MSRRKAAKAEVEERVAREIARRRERGEPFVPLQVARQRGSPADTFWGRAWCAHMEGLSDFRDRLAPAKRALRGGDVYDLAIEPGEAFAYVTGPELHEVLVRVEPVDDVAWQRLVERCAGEVASLAGLLQGKLGDAAMRALTDPGAGLFPRLDEVRVQCDCDDFADLCPHGAAVLYAVGIRLDAEPELLFRLRDRDQGDLVARAAQSATTAPAQRHPEDRPRLQPGQLSQIFGLEITDPGSAFPDEDP